MKRLLVSIIILSFFISTFVSAEAPPASCKGKITQFTNETTANGVYYVDANGDMKHLALGANGTVLTSAGATSAPTFSAAGAGDITAVGSCTENSCATIGNGATSAGYIDLLEDSDNGTNRVRLQGAASTADVIATFPAETGTVCTTGSVCTGYQGALTAATVDFGACNFDMDACTVGLPPIGGALIPDGADTRDLGSNAAEWANLFLGDGAIIYGQNDSSNTITSSATGWAFGLDITVTGADATLAAAGVKLTGSNGALTILGLGDGQDEDVKIDLNSTANTIEITSPASSATAVDFNTLNLVTTGTIQAGITINTDANGMTGAEMTTAGVYGTMFIASGAGTWTLPTAVAGMSLCLYAPTNIDVILDIQAGDTMALSGAADTAGDGITNATGASTGDFVCVIATGAGAWSAFGRSGTWTQQ